MTLSFFSILIGLVMIGLYGLALKHPEPFYEHVKAYPRSEWPGRILTALCLPWAAYYLIITPPVAGNNLLTKLVLLLTPVAFFLVLKYLKELLSARALGGFLMLLATPLLQTARMHESTWSIAITLLAYAIAVKGMMLVLSPFKFRQYGEWLFSRPGLLRGFLCLGLALGVLFLVLGLFVY